MTPDKIKQLAIAAKAQGNVMVMDAPEVLKLFDRIEAQDAAIQQLRDALKEVTQSLVWCQFGECRGFTDGMPLPAITSAEMAKAALAATEKING